jgi:hypothetical protein
MLRSSTEDGEEPSLVLFLDRGGASITTPHSQLRQLSLGLPLPRSFTRRPLFSRERPLASAPVELESGASQARAQRTHQALSDRLALPTYAKFLPRFVPKPDCRTNRILLCMSTPCLVDWQSRRTLRGKDSADHHLNWKQIVPAPCWRDCQYASGFT